MEREARPSAPLHEVAAALRAELDRLEDLYEGHLRRVAASASDSRGLRRSAEKLKGVRVVSVLHTALSKQALLPEDLHVIIGPESGPVPVLNTSPAPVRRHFQLDPDWIPETGGGWVDHPGKPLLFAVRGQAGKLVVFTLDAEELERAILMHLRGQWSGFSPILRGTGADQLRSRRGGIVVTNGMPPSAPADLQLTVSVHLGVWDILSWDPRNKRIRYEPAILAGSMGIAVLTAFAGLGLYGNQRRVAAEAAKRVSFVNRVSHELRTPLTNILLHLDLAAEAAEDESPATLRSLGLARDEAGRLARLIQNVLTFSCRDRKPASTGKTTGVPDTIIRTTIENFATAFQRREIRWETDLAAGCACLLDADALAQVLANLFSNVEKYAPESVLRIESRWSVGILRIVVADNGPGIPEEAAERIFQPFERLSDRVDEGVSGTGLGLAIARDLAVEMGGSLCLETAQAGARFVVELPAPASYGLLPSNGLGSEAAR